VWSNFYGSVALLCAAATFSSAWCCIVVIGVVVVVVVVSGLVGERWVGWVLSSVIEYGGGGGTCLWYLIDGNLGQRWECRLWCGDCVLCWTSELVCGVG